MARFTRDFRAPIRRRRDGDYTVALGEQERELLRSLLRQLRELLSTDSPALARLFPPPYGDDEERNAGYAALAGSELVEGRLEAIDAVDATVDDEVVDEPTLLLWMRTINDVRLVLGTMLDVVDDDDPPDPGSGDSASFAAYEYLGAVLEMIVRALGS